MIVCIPELDVRISVRTVLERHGLTTALLDALKSKHVDELDIQTAIQVFFDEMENDSKIKKNFLKNSKYRNSFN